MPSVVCWAATSYPAACFSVFGSSFKLCSFLGLAANRIGNLISFFSVFAVMFYLIVLKFMPFKLGVCTKTKYERNANLMVFHELVP